MVAGERPGFNPGTEGANLVDQVKLSGKRTLLPSTSGKSSDLTVT